MSRKIKALEIKLTNGQITSFNETLKDEIDRVSKLIMKQNELNNKYAKISHRTAELSTKMDKIDSFADSIVDNRADINTLTRAFEETSRVQGEVRLVQQDLLGGDIF